ncbi:MAG TPA: hypothetical protein VFZ26_09505, partial [Gemmatimonadales bacterium]
MLFLLPFMGFGLFAGVQAARHAATGDWQQAGFFGLFALVFGGVGFGGLAAVSAGRRRLAERAALEARHPDSPWLWRADWAAGRIEDSNRGTMWAAWVFAGFWNLISLPSAWFALRAALDQGRKAALLALLFPLVGVGLLAWAVRATLRYRRYGVSVLELSRGPGVVGHSLAGVVRTTSPLRPVDGFRVQLVCIRRVTRGSGKNRSTSERVLWEEDRRVQGEPGRTAQGMSISVPFSFAIPADAEPCDDSDPRDSVLWRLRAEASMPGVDYESTFDVPVFRTAASDTPASGSEPGTPEEPYLPADYRQPPQSRIRVTTNRRGTEVHFPAARNPGAAAGATAFLAIWVGAIALMLGLGAPILFVIVFGLFGLLILWGVLELWLRVTRVTAEPGSLVLASGYLSPVRERRFPAVEIRGCARPDRNAGGRYALLRSGRGPPRRQDHGRRARHPRQARGRVVRGGPQAGPRPGLIPRLRAWCRPRAGPS